MKISELKATKDSQGEWTVTYQGRIIAEIWDDEINTAAKAKKAALEDYDRS